jgi:hypothetical protein
VGLELASPQRSGEAKEQVYGGSRFGINFRMIEGIARTQVNNEGLVRKEAPSEPTRGRGTETGRLTCDAGYGYYGSGWEIGGR